MNKSELIEQVHFDLQSRGFDVTKKQVKQTVESTMDVVQDAIISGEGFAYPKFGTFKTNVRAAYTGHNPAKGEPVEVPAATVVKFKPSTVLKGRLNS
jgi:DNA-binding protein HU-beta